MLHTLSKLWWVLALRGLCALVVGIGAFVVPAATLAVLVLTFGAYALVEGCLRLARRVDVHRLLRLKETTVVINGRLGRSE